MSDFERIDFGAFIAQKRREQGMSQRKLAALSGYHLNTLNAYEKGLRKMSINALQDILQVLQCALSVVPIQPLTESKEDVNDTDQRTGS